jgi:hypothetical protein
MKMISRADSTGQLCGSMSTTVLYGLIGTYARVLSRSAFAAIVIAMKP